LGQQVKILEEHVTAHAAYKVTVVCSTLPGKPMYTFDAVEVEEDGKILFPRATAHGDITYTTVVSICMCMSMSTHTQDRIFCKCLRTSIRKVLIQKLREAAKRCATRGKRLPQQQQQQACFGIPYKLHPSIESGRCPRVRAQTNVFQSKALCLYRTTLCTFPFLTAEKGSPDHHL
jgi:hypothetical protein